MNSHVARISVLVSIVALAAAISLTVVPHDGQGRAARDRFAGLDDRKQDQVLEFLNSL